MIRVELLPLTFLPFVVLAANDTPSHTEDSCDRSQTLFQRDCDSCDDVDLGELQLLQSGLHMVRRVKTPPQAKLSRSYAYPDLYWGISSDTHMKLQEIRNHQSSTIIPRVYNASGFEFSNVSGKCSIDVPENIATDEQEVPAERHSLQHRSYTSGFAFGMCPTVLDVKRERIDLQLDYLLHGFNSSGFNPSLVHMPSYLLAAFPTGKWLAMVRAGGELLWACPWTRQNESEQSYLHHMNQGTFAVVFDRNMQVLAQSKVRVPDREGLYDEAAVMDGRLTLLKNGDILLSYTPYELEFHSPHGLWTTGRTWWARQVVTKLHIRATRATVGQDVVLDAWVNKAELRYLSDCRTDDTHKNIGFFEVQGELYALDSILPLKVGKLNLSRSAPQDDEEYIKEIVDESQDNEEFLKKLVTEEYMKKLCFEPQPPAAQVKLDPYHGTFGQGFDSVEELSLHNGPSPIWIEELNAFLGVGHLRRGYEGKSLERWSHHYMHQWFAFSRIQPFSLVSVSPEFCFGSEEHPGDCEVTQFVSSLTRDGDKLVVGFGVMDCEAAVTTLSLNETLQSLKLVS